MVLDNFFSGFERLPGERVAGCGGRVNLGPNAAGIVWGGAGSDSGIGGGSGSGWRSGGGGSSGDVSESWDGGLSEQFEIHIGVFSRWRNLGAKGGEEGAVGAAESRSTGTRSGCEELRCHLETVVILFQRGERNESIAGCFVLI